MPDVESTSEEVGQEHGDVNNVFVIEYDYLLNTCSNHFPCLCQLVDDLLECGYRMCHVCFLVDSKL